MLQVAAVIFAMCTTPIHVGGPSKILDMCTSLGEACACEMPISQIRYKPENTERSCRTLAGKEQREGEGRSHEAELNVHRFSECMMGR